MNIYIVIPQRHIRAGNRRQPDGARETLVTLGVIVLQANLKFDSFQEVALLGLIGVLQELRDLRPDISCESLLARLLSSRNDGCRVTWEPIDSSHVDGPMASKTHGFLPTEILDILAVSQ